MCELCEVSQVSLEWQSGVHFAAVSRLVASLSAGRAVYSVSQYLPYRIFGPVETTEDSYGGATGTTIGTKSCDALLLTALTVAFRIIGLQLVLKLLAKY
jgi:hypothetical protein